MTKPLVCEYNCETKEEVVREMNDVEYEQHLIDVAKSEIEG